MIAVSLNLWRLIVSGTFCQHFGDAYVSRGWARIQIWAEAEKELCGNVNLLSNGQITNKATKINQWEPRLFPFFNAAVLIVNEIQKNRNRTIQLRFPKHYQAGWLSMKQTLPLLLIKNTKHLQNVSVLFCLLICGGCERQFAQTKMTERNHWQRGTKFRLAFLQKLCQVFANFTFYIL